MTRIETKRLLIECNGANLFVMNRRTMVDFMATRSRQGFYWLEKGDRFGNRYTAIGVMDDFGNIVKRKPWAAEK